MNGNELHDALTYLLLSNLKLQTRDAAGREGNSRLVQLFFALLQVAVIPNVFCDVGANDGSTAVIARYTFPGARVISLEANPHIHQAHVSRLTAEGIESLNLAASSMDGSVQIFVPRTGSRAYLNGEIAPAVIEEAPATGNTSMLKRNEDATYEELVVTAATLDSLLAESLQKNATRRIALWIDVEGAAYEVLQGAECTLQLTSMLFVKTEGFAFWKDQKLSGQVAQFLISRGFLPISRDREYGDKQFNTIFMHSSLIEFVLPALAVVNRDAAAPVAPQVPVMKTPDPAGTHRVRAYPSLAASVAAEIPVYIPTFNNPTYTRHMISQLAEWNLKNIIIVDNGSTDAEMLAYLEQLQQRVKLIRLPSNSGPQALIAISDNYDCLPELFCITDPDLLFRPDMPQDFLLTLLKATNSLQIGKAGLALDIEDRHLMKAERFAIGGSTYQIWEWEEQFWTRQRGTTEDGSPIFMASIDTTFALYNKKFFKPELFYNAVRLGGRYACKHLPWYKDVGISAKEEHRYRNTQKFSFYMR